jgi:multidrug efflux pump subunit AcrB/ABC-type multidrug transport system ATPase subunit
MKFIIQRKTLISMLFIGMSLLGLFSYRQLNMELYPTPEMPKLMVQISSPTEVDPSYMEQAAVIPTEAAISAMEGIDKIETRISNRNSRIEITYNSDVDIKYAYLKLEQKLNSVKSSLPEGFITNLIKSGMGSINNQFMSIQIIGSGGVDRVRNVTDKDIKMKLESIDGIATVDIYGGREKSLDIILNHDKCEAYNITPSYIASLISSGQKDKTFVGAVIDNKKQFFVNVFSEYNSLSELENIVLNTKGPILLKDVATIKFGVKAEESYSRVNGKEAITAVLTKTSQVNLIELSDRTKEAIASINKEMASKDISLIVQHNTAKTMENNIDQIINLALVGGILAIIILWLFLKNIGIVAVISLAIPASIYSAFNFFYAFDISINSLTLVGIALAIGMLLDNSIVVMENIHRLSSKGYDPDRAVTQGTQEVWRSVIAATLTTITVFLPFIFASDPMIKLIGKHIGVSIISTLLISLVVALLLIPMSTHYFLKRNKKKNFINLEAIPFHNRLMQIYILLLKMCLRNPAKTIIGAVIVFFITIFSCIALNSGGLEKVEVKQFEVFVKMPSGSTLAKTDAEVRKIEAKLEDIEEKSEIISKIYENEAQITIKIKEDFEETNTRKLSDIRHDIEEMTAFISETADISMEASESSEQFRGGGDDASAGMLSMFGIGSSAEKVVIKGQDFAAMTNLAQDIKYYIDEIDEINSSRMNYSESRPEAKIEFDQHLMGLYGITPNMIAKELNTFNNQTSTTSVFKDNNETYVINIKDEEADRLKKLKLDRPKDLDALKELVIQGSNKSNHKLSSFSNIIKRPGKAQIKRVNQEKEIAIKYYIDEQIQDDKTLLEGTRTKIDDIVARLKLPAGIAVEVIHEEDNNSEYLFLIAAAFALIFMILASVFESISAPFVLMFSIPLAAIGSFIGLILTDNTLFGSSSIIGFIILLGVVVNNGIILIDYTKILRKRGLGRSRAVITAGMARVRPILITALTTIIAMLPLAMGDQEYVSSIGAPFAITVIGGLTVSTLLTLLFIPTMYVAMESSLAWVRELNLKTKLSMILIFIGAASLIYFKVDSLTFQMLYMFVAIVGVPGSTWFILNSLRKADTSIIGEDEEINIKIRNLVKIYDRESKLEREWLSGKKIRERLGMANSYKTISDLKETVWQAPVLAFLLYFTYSHLDSGFMIFVFAFIVWRILILILDNFKMYLEFNAKKRLFKIFRISRWTIFWFLPLINSVFIGVSNESVAQGIFSAIFYYTALIIMRLSNKLHKENIKIDSIGGTFGGIKRASYKFVKVVPFIGKKHNPFKANKGISLDIHTGMFGLLGPNGAGKTTLMRTICGVFEQTYGKIWINGIDTQEKREELQGLIGYLPQEFGTYENLTSWEFLDYQAILKGIKDPDTRFDRVKQVLEAVHMIENKDKKIGGFSGGMKQRIGIAQTLLHLPRILVVDEPTAGLDPRERIRFRNLLVELSKKRIVIFSTHIIEDIASSCNQVAVIAKGELKYFGVPQEMTDMANGHVWQFDVPANEFEEATKDYLVIHHMNTGDNIRVRCLSADSPYEGAISLNPLLEDSYLWLIKQN